MKDIAIYRLQRVEKALERLDGAVSRLDAAMSVRQADKADPVDPSVESAQNVQYDLAQAELTALRADYERLRAAATTVSGRLDKTISRLETESAAAPSESAA